MRIKVNLRLLKINDKIEVELQEGSTVKSLLEKLLSIYGDDLKRLIGDPARGFMVMVMSNGEMLKYDAPLKDESEVSLVLPIAGG
ncbi:MoaD/ThiS family protein [Candidatus Aerophobetes bacterium]|nr:MoaD/ThiS family protein [Candidatus Aerophobetes bacterium]